MSTKLEGERLKERERPPGQGRSGDGILKNDRNVPDQRGGVSYPMQRKGRVKVTCLGGPEGGALETKKPRLCGSLFGDSPLFF